LSNFKNIEISMTKAFFESIKFTFPLTWFSFDNIYEICINQSLNIITSNPEFNLKNLFITYYPSILIFLPFDIITLFYPYLNIKTNEEKMLFEQEINKNQIEIYNKFVHSDGLYYGKKPADYNGINSFDKIFPPK